MSWFCHPRNQLPPLAEARPDQHQQGHFPRRKEIVCEGHCRMVPSNCSTFGWICGCSAQEPPFVTAAVASVDPQLPNVLLHDQRQTRTASFEHVRYEHQTNSIRFEHDLLAFHAVSFPFKVAATALRLWWVSPHQLAQRPPAMRKHIVIACFGKPWMPS